MSYAQNIFTTTSPNETNFVITWTPPYYMSTADVKAEVDNESAAIDKVAWTVASVSGTNVTLATGIPTNSTVRIYRETDVSSNEITFLAGSPFRAGDVNLNFDQTLFAIQEALTSDENHENDIDRLEGLIDAILLLLNNNIQFVQVANVAALDTTAASDPDNLKGYEVLDSTGLEGANPSIPLLPPKVGTGPNEDPVTGVYWDSGISTKVLWDKANQNWIYVSYFASNGDNRYQQITLQQATAPVLADFKNGTLWFNTTDQNLYVLYDDSGTRSWVLVGPLRDDRYVNKTGDSMTGDLLMINANVGIGTESPQSNLHIDGTDDTLLKLQSSAASSYINFINSSNALGYIGYEGTGLGFYTNNLKHFEIDADSTIKFSNNSSERMRISSSGNVGIGTASPSNTLSLEGSGTGLSINSTNDEVKKIEFKNSGTTVGYFGSSSSSPARFLNSSAGELMRIDSSGRVGIGTSSPANNLDLAIDSNNEGIRLSSSTNVFGKIDFHANRSGADAALGILDFNWNGTQVARIIGGTGTDTTNKDDGELQFHTAAAGSASEAMRIDSSGNVGIGVTNISNIANRSQLVVGGSSGGLIDLNVGNTTEGRIFVADTAFTFRASQSDGDLIFQTGGSNERLRIDSSGKVGIGTSSPLTGSKLTVAGNALAVTGQNTAHSANSIRIGEEGSGAAEIRCYGPDASTNGSLRLRVSRSDGSNSKDVLIDSSGNVGIGTTSNLLSSATRTTLSLSNTASSAIALGVNGTREGHLYADANSVELSATNNYMYFTAGSSERMRIDTSGRLLLGTTTEGHQQADNFTIGNSGHVGITLRAGSTSASSIFFADGTSGADEYRGYLEYAHSDNSLRLATNAGERMRIDSSGNVGIGNSDPGALLHVSDSGDHAILRVGGNNAGGTGLDINYSNSGPTTTSIKQSYRASNADAQLKIDTGFFTIHTGTSGTERMRIDSSGRVGIGCTPSSSFQLKRATPELSLQPTSNSQSGYITFINTSSSTKGSIEYAYSNDHMAFKTDSVERMRINSNGHVLLNTATDLAFFSIVDSSYGASDIFIRTFGASSASFIVRGDGDCENTNNSYGALSDVKLKENIIDAGLQWDDIKALQVRSYNLKTNPSTPHIGLIAQEVETVSPGLVSELPDRDEDGNNLGTVTKSVKYSVLYMKAVKALQEAMERIEVLEQRLTDAGIA